MSITPQVPIADPVITFAHSHLILILAFAATAKECSLEFQQLASPNDAGYIDAPENRLR